MLINQLLYVLRNHLPSRLPISGRLALNCPANSAAAVWPKGFKSQRPLPYLVVTVSCQLTAVWLLDSSARERYLLTIKDIEDRVTEADLAGLKEPRELSPEEEEFEEEMQQMMSKYSEYGSDDESKPGEASFACVVYVSDQDRTKAMADAFGKAKRAAAELAKAAGAELGKLVQLTGGGGGTPDDDYSAQAYAPWGYRQMLDAAEFGEHYNLTEGVSADPGAVNFKYTVTATFQLAPAR